MVVGLTVGDGAGDGVPCWMEVEVGCCVLCVGLMLWICGLYAGFCAGGGKGGGTTGRVKVVLLLVRVVSSSSLRWYSSLSGLGRAAVHDV